MLLIAERVELSKSGRRVRHRVARLTPSTRRWIVGLLVGAVAIVLPIQYDTTGAHAQSFFEVRHDLLAGHGHETLHPHGDAMEQTAWPVLAATLAAVGRAGVSLRIFATLAVSVGVVATVELTCAVGLRGPPRRYQFCAARSGRATLADLCIIRR